MNLVAKTRSDSLPAVELLRLSDSEKQTPTGRLSGAGRADGCFDCFRFAGGIIDVEVMTVGGCDVRPEIL